MRYSSKCYIYLINLDIIDYYYLFINTILETIGNGRLYRR